MSLDVSGLSVYTDQAKNDLIRASLLKARTIEMISVQPGIKSSAAINILSSSPIWTAGGCGFTNSGTTVLTQRNITVCDLKKNESICLDTLENYWIQSRMKPGSYNEDIPFEQMYSEEVAGQTAKFVEQLTWQGNATSGAGNLSLCDGLLAVISGATGVVSGTTLALNAANIVDAVDALIAAMPADMIDSEDLTVFLGYDSYRVYAAALRDANLFAYTGAENQGGQFEQMHPGTNVKVVGVGGLNGQNRAVLAEASNLFAGVDLMSDSEDFSIWYSMDNQEVRVVQKMKIGFQVAFPTRIVVKIGA